MCVSLAGRTKDPPRSLRAGAHRIGIKEHIVFVVLVLVVGRRPQQLCMRPPRSLPPLVTGGRLSYIRRRAVPRRSGGREERPPVRCCGVVVVAVVVVARCGVFVAGDRPSLSPPLPLPVPLPLELALAPPTTRISSGPVSASGVTAQVVVSSYSSSRAARYICHGR